MKLLWITSQKTGHVDDTQLTEKPALSFEFEYIRVNDDVAEYCPKERANYPQRIDVPEAEMIADFANRPLSDLQLAELTGFYKSFPRESRIPEFDFETQRVSQEGTEVINGLTYKKWVVTQKSAEELEELRVRKEKEFQNSVISKASENLNSFARERGYDGILSVCSYVSSTNPRYVTDATVAIQLRDATWDKLYQIMDEVQSGVRPKPTTVDEVISELPALVWDSV
jgi:uncharacterized protein (UPF0297 family)